MGVNILAFGKKVKKMTRRFNVYKAFFYLRFNYLPKLLVRPVYPA